MHSAGESGHPTAPPPPPKKNLVPKQPGIQSPPPPPQPLAASSVLAVFEWLGCLTNVAELNRVAGCTFSFPLAPVALLWWVDPITTAIHIPGGASPPSGMSVASFRWDMSPVLPPQTMWVHQHQLWVSG